MGGILTKMKPPVWCLLRSHRMNSNWPGWKWSMKDKNWRGGKAKKEKKGNQQSGELAEVVDSIGRSLLGLIFLSIFINGIKMQRNTFEKANNSEKLTEKNTKEKKRVVFP